MGLLLCGAMAFTTVGAMRQWCGLSEAAAHSRLCVTSLSLHVIGFVMVSLCFLVVWRWLRIMLGWLIYVTQLAVTCCTCDYSAWFDCLWRVYPSSSTNVAGPCCLPQYIPFCFGEVCATAASGVLLCASVDLMPPRTATAVRQAV